MAKKLMTFATAKRSPSAPKSSTSPKKYGSIGGRVVSGRAKKGR